MSGDGDHELDRRQVAGYVGRAFELLGSMERRELVEMMAAAGAPAELLALVERRIRDDTRIRSLRQLWDHLGDLPVTATAGDDAPLLALAAGDEALLSTGELRRLVDDLASAAERADERIGRLEGDLDRVRAVRAAVGERAEAARRRAAAG